MDMFTPYETLWYPWDQVLLCYLCCLLLNKKKNQRIVVSIMCDFKDMRFNVDVCNTLHFWKWHCETFYFDISRWCYPTFDLTTIQTLPLQVNLFLRLIWQVYKLYLSKSISSSTTVETPRVWPPMCEFRCPVWLLL